MDTNTNFNTLSAGKYLTSSLLDVLFPMLAIAKSGERYSGHLNIQE